MLRYNVISSPCSQYSFTVQNPTIAQFPEKACNGLATACEKLFGFYVHTHSLIQCTKIFLSSSHASETTSATRIFTRLPHNTHRNCTTLVLFASPLSPMWFCFSTLLKNPRSHCSVLSQFHQSVILDGREGVEYML